MSVTNNGGRGPFASALRSLAKQADIKDDEQVDQRATASASTNSTANNANMHQRNTTTNIENRIADPTLISEDQLHKNKSSSSPPEKVFLKCDCRS